MLFKFMWLNKYCLKTKSFLHNLQKNKIECKRKNFLVGEREKEMPWRREEKNKNKNPA